MRGALLASLLGLALLASASTAGARSPQALEQLLAVDLQDVPLGEALATIAARLGLQLENRGAAEPSARITANVPRVSAEVLLLVLAWETRSEALPAPGVLRWGAARELPSTELAAYRRERALRLEHKALLLRRRLSEPVRFRLKVEELPLADTLRFLQRELSVPLFLDPQAGAELGETVHGEFADLTLAQLLDRLVSGEGSATSDSTAARSVPSPTDASVGRQTASSADIRKSTPAPSRASGAEESPGGPASLGWAVVGDLVVVSTPAHLYSLRSLSQ